MDKKKLIAILEEHLRDELAAQPRADRKEQINHQLMVLKHLPLRDYGPDDWIVPSALVELEMTRARAHYFIVPSGGGLVTHVDGQPVQVITPQSPLGAALIGKKQGDEVTVDSRGGTRTYRVIAIV